MKIRVNSVDHIFSNPLYGYTTIIELATKFDRLTGHEYAFWDDGSTFDVRKCKCRWVLDSTEFNTLIDIFINQSKGRNQNLEMTPDIGFFPFGPDKGDNVIFSSVRMSEPIKQSASIGHPQDRFPVEVEFVFNGASFPSYTPPSPGIGGQKAQGTLDIGTVTNLRYPPEMHNLGTDYAINTVLTTDGTPHGNEMKNTNDSYISTLNMLQNESQTAALITHIVGTVRTNQVTVIPPTFSFMFGRENNGTASYGCKLLQNRIEVTHNRHNEFTIPLTFWLETIL